MIFRNFFYSVTFLLVCAGALAKDLRLIAWDDSVAARKLSIVHEKGRADIAYLHPFDRSEKVSIPAEPVGLRIEARDRPVTEAGPAATALKIPAEIKRPLVILFPNEKDAAGLSMLVVEDDPGEFKWGTFRFLNATGKPLVFIWENKRANLPAGYKPVSVAPGGDQRNMEVKVFLPDNAKQPIYSAIWEQRDDLRQWVFLVPSEDVSAGPLAIKFIAESQAAAAAEAEAGKPKQAGN